VLIMSDYLVERVLALEADNARLRRVVATAIVWRVEGEIVAGDTGDNFIAAVGNLVAAVDNYVNAPTSPSPDEFVAWLRARTFRQADND
jgi:hypothetical protein